MARIYQFSWVPLKHVEEMVKDAWAKLCRRIETAIEHVIATNGEAVAAITRGMVLYISGDREMSIASAAIGATAAEASWAGVAVRSSVPVGGTLIVRTDNVAYALVEDEGAAPVAGEVAYLSPNVPGRVTNIQPDQNGEYIARVGKFLDMTGYNAATNPFAWVLLDRCCDPTDRRG